MDIQRLLRTGMAMVLTAFTLAACTQQEDIPAAQGEPLPPGKYPLKLRIVGYQASPATRSTVDGTWDGGEIFYVQAASNKEEGTDDVYAMDMESVSSWRYSVSDGKLVPYGGPTRQHFWDWKDETKYIRAFSYDASVLVGQYFDVQGDQSSDEKLLKSDVLYGYTVVSFADREQEVELEMRHLTAMVVFNLKKSDYVDGHPDDIAVKLKSEKNDIVLWGKFTGDNWDGMKLEKLVDGAITTQEMTLNRTEQPGEGHSATFRAIVIPQSLEGKNFSVEIDVAGTKYTADIPNPESGKWEGGSKYVYNVSVGAKRLSTVKQNL